MPYKTAYKPHYDPINFFSAQMNTILIPHSPGSLKDIQSQIHEAIITANQVPGSKKINS